MGQVTQLILQEACLISFSFTEQLYEIRLLLQAQGYSFERDT